MAFSICSGDIATRIAVATATSAPKKLTVLVNASLSRKNRPIHAAASEQIPSRQLEIDRGFMVLLLDGFRELKTVRISFNDIKSYR